MSAESEEAARRYLRDIEFRDLDRHLERQVRFFNLVDQVALGSMFAVLTLVLAGALYLLFALAGVLA